MGKTRGLFKKIRDSKGTNGATGVVKANASIMQWEQNLVFSSENEGLPQ